MPDKSMRSSSPGPVLSQKVAKRPRLDAMPSRQSPSLHSQRMDVELVELEREEISSLADSPIHVTNNVIHHQWSPSSSALAPDPNAPGSSGHHFQGGHYFTVTSTTSVPIAVSAPKSVFSSSTLSSASSSPSSCTIASVSSVAFDSDTWTSIHNASTTSLDYTHGVFTSQIAQQSGGSPGRGFQLKFNHSDIRHDATHSKVTYGEPLSPNPVEQSSKTIASESSWIDRPRSVGGANVSASLPPLWSHGGAPCLDTSAQAGQLQPVTITDVPASLGSNSLSQTSVSEPNLPSRLDSSVFPSHQQVDSMDSPDQTMNLIYPSNPFASTLARDALLMHAYRIYDSPASPLPTGLSPSPIGPTITDPSSSSHPYTTQLLPLLIALRGLHPHHLPTLLLFGCVLYAVGDFQGSLTINSEILHIDPHYVEAISNIGTTLKAMRRSQEAEAWWWKAIRLRPVYWDATDNLLGALCVPFDESNSGQSISPRYEDALFVCEFVQSRVLNENGCFLVDVPPAQRHRVQSLLYTNGSLRYIMGHSDSRSSAISLHLRALDLLMRPSNPRSDNDGYSTVDVVIAVCVAGLLASAGPGTPLASDIACALGISDSSRFSSRVLEQGFNVLDAVHNAGPRLIETLLRMGDGILPMTLLLPDQVSRLPFILFASSAGILPGLCDRSLKLPLDGESPIDVTPALRMTSTVLLTLARIFQHVSTTSQSTLPVKGISVGASTSLVLLFYYLALAIYPSPATCNNLGIILSTVSVSTLTTDSHGQQEVVNGQVLAKAYYKKGLSQEGAHPHLLTNLGSLLKDQGKIDDAIFIYAKAIDIKPDFDVALANMGNAIKDTGRPQESIAFYRRAVAANPNFQEAVCGLANALSAICDWRGRGGISGEPQLDEDGRMTASFPNGWINKVVEICNEQILAGYSYGVGVIQSHSSLKQWLGTLETAFGRPFRRGQRKRWAKMFQRFFIQFDHQGKKVNEGGTIIKLIELVIRITQRRWYIDAYGQQTHASPDNPPMPVYEHLSDYELQKYKRPRIPALGTPPVPSVLPFHTFTYPLSSRATRLMSYRNALRISYMTQTQSWLPAHVYPPPPPLPDRLKVGYVSNDLINHPLAHLMQSVFGLHDRTKFEVHVYATSPSDGSRYRRKIEEESEHFLDVSTKSTREIVERIVMDGIHLLINLGGYTKGARNDIFAARPSPVQLQFMGFAGTLAAGWCDYLVSDVICCPPDTCAWDRWRQRREQGGETSRMQDHFVELDLETDADFEADPESLSDDWMYTEHMIYMPHTFFVTDHKQSAERFMSVSSSRTRTPWQDEEDRRLRMRQTVFPDLDSDAFIFANFNQLYKIDPVIFASWLRILGHIPNSILWLLRFPAAGEVHIARTANLWAGPEVASRVIFTEVASKDEHLRRTRVADLVLDTVDCSAHTIATDVLWAGTPIITWPKYKTKMCSRVAASIAYATGYGKQMVVDSLEEYEARAIRYAKSLSYDIIRNSSGEIRRRGKGELIELRRNLYLSREDMPLFDTLRWTRNMEKGLAEAWRRWIAGTCFETSDEWEDCKGPEKESGSIWVSEDGQ